jgi:hypothetical protein
MKHEIIFGNKLVNAVILQRYELAKLSTWAV